MRSALYVRALLALATALLLGGTLLSGPGGSATAAATAVAASRLASCNIPHCWSAISFNTATGRSGWTDNKASRARAVERAIYRCKNRDENRLHRSACQNPNNRNVYAENGCVAVAFRRNNGRIVEWAKGKSYGPIVAKRRARRAVAGPGEVLVSAWACSRRRVN